MENTENNFEPTMPDSNGVNFQSRLDLAPLLEGVEKIKKEIETVIVGQHKMIDQLLVAILSNGHILIEGVPGVAKTITAKILAKTIKRATPSKTRQNAPKRQKPYIPTTETIKRALIRLKMRLNAIFQLFKTYNLHF